MAEEYNIAENLLDTDSGPVEKSLDESSLSEGLNSTEESEKDLVIDEKKKCDVEEESFEEEYEDEVARGESPAKKAKLEDAEKPAMFKFMFVNECLDEDLEDGLDSAKEDSDVGEEANEAPTEGDDAVGSDGVGSKLVKGSNVNLRRNKLRRNQMKTYLGNK